MDDKLPTKTAKFMSIENLYIYSILCKFTNQCKVIINVCTVAIAICNLT